MASPEADTRRLTEPQLVALWTTLGVAERTGDTVATLAPPPGATAEAGSLPLLLSETHPHADVSVIGPLAEGGMARVHRGLQRSLSREVAVKVLKPEVSDPRSRAELLREARIAGSLEHPNIIPVHALGTDPRGEPVLVMKRVEGISWRRFMCAPDDRAALFAGDTPLEKNLDVLMQVAKAVHFAHCRGVVHRDLKPDNVMVGDFGEVYLLDWGIAVRVADGCRSGEVVGTPAYMAPEMVAPEHPVTPATDVFLLGAVLYELLVGSPPHEGRSIYAAMHAAYRCEPPAFGPAVPEGLARICCRAMARDPAERYATAEAFRQKIAAWLRHRDSLAVAEEARGRLAELEAAIAAGEAAPTRLYRLFGAARFGFEQALRIWPGNAEAHVGLQATLTRMAELELSLGQADAAEALIAELEAPAPALRDQLARARARSRARELELAALRALEHDLDADVGARTRSRVALGLGVVLALLSVGAGWLVRTYAPEGPRPMHYLLHSVLLVLVGSGFILGNGRSLLQNRFNRQISTMTLLAFAGGLFFRVLVALAELPFLVVFPLELALYALAVALMGLATHRRLAWGAVPLAAGAVVMALRPEWTFEACGVALLLATGWLGAVWSPAGPANATSTPPSRR